MPHFDALGIVCKDINTSLRFYGLLGVPVPMDSEGEDHVEAVLPNGLRLMFDALELVKQINPNWTAPVGHRMGMAFQCGSPAEVDETYQDVLEEGFAGVSEPFDAFWGQRYAQVSDPDGNVVDLFAPL